jgi:hypothetical protein
MLDITSSNDYTYGILSLLGPQSVDNPTTAKI